MEEFIHNIQSKARKNSRWSGYTALVLGILSLSVSPILVKTSDAPGIVTSFYRMACVIRLT